jgi:hypothetical protein
MPTIVRSIPPRFREPNIASEQMRSILMLCGAAMFGWLLHSTYGLDVSYAFF